jgi:GT2 family glycosyltransferase
VDRKSSETDGESAGRSGSSPSVETAEVRELRRRLEALEAQAKARRAELYDLRWQVATLLRDDGWVGWTTRLKLLGRARLPRLYAHLAQVLSRARTPGPQQPSRSVSERAPPVALRPDVRLPTPIAIATNAGIAEDICRHASETSVIRMEAAMGRVAMARDPVDYFAEASPASLAHWLITHDRGELAAIGTFVVDAADSVSLDLLHGRLTDRQTLVVAGSPGADGPALGTPTARDPLFAWHNKLPEAWLDPLDARGLPVDARVASRSWPKISVVLVSFNQAAFVEEAICSVLEQGYPNLELVVIDGASTDGSVAILSRYRDRCAHFLSEPDGGQSEGLNKGFARATGEILCWLNSDDLLEPGALFRVAQAFARFGTDMVVGGCRQVRASADQVMRNHHSQVPFARPLPLPLGLLLEFDRYWQTAKFFFQPEVFFTRAIWRRAGGRLRTDLYYLLDYDLWVRMAAAGATVAHIPDFLARSRTHDRQKTTGDMPYLPELQRLLSGYCERLSVPPGGSHS